MPIPIVVDCDPGHDDALALMLALASPELEVRGITTVGGNATLEHTTENALRVLTLLGRTDVPVAAGASAPLVGPLHTAPQVHGASGLEGADLPAPAAAARPEGAVEFLAGLLRATDEPLTLVPTGPLTNIALLLEHQPQLRDRIGRICLMGGSAGEGNVTPSAEFNIWVDPEAARIVFRSGLPLTMIGLDVTHQALLMADETAALAATGGKVARTVADLLAFYMRFHRERYGWNGSPIHDAVAVAHLARPGMVKTAPYYVDVELAGELTRGRTVVDTRDVLGRPPNAEVGVGIDRRAFVELLVEAIRSFG